MQPAVQTTRYQQISRSLSARISAGDYAPGEQLPTELELSSHFQVNRHTVREAIRELKNDGLIFSVRGKGNFVAANKIIYRLTDKVRFTQNILDSKQIPGSSLIAWTERPATGDIAQKLDLPLNRAVLELHILRTVNELPFSIAASYLPAERFRGLPQLIDGSFSLYTLLKEHYRVDPQRRESQIETRLPDSDEMCLLQCSARQPLLIINSVATDMQHRPIEYVQTRTRGDLGTLAIDFRQLGPTGAAQ